MRQIPSAWRIGIVKDTEWGAEQGSFFPNMLCCCLALVAILRLRRRTSLAVMEGQRDSMAPCACVASARWVAETPAQERGTSLFVKNCQRFGLSSFLCFISRLMFVMLTRFRALYNRVFLTFVRSDLLVGRDWDEGKRGEWGRHVPVKRFLCFL